MRAAWMLIGVMGLAGCQSRETPPAPAAASGAAAEGLTAFQVEHGIGPVTEPMTLGAIDAAMATAGRAIFEQKCAACHKLEEKYVGPALEDVTERRSPAFIMNMMLNPQEMTERHPAVKQLVAEHMTLMPNQGLTRDEARRVLEYLRTVDDD